LSAAGKFSEVEEPGRISKEEESVRGLLLSRKGEKADKMRWKSWRGERKRRRKRKEQGEVLERLGGVTLKNTVRMKRSPLQY